jgi:hypothetical protein
VAGATVTAINRETGVSRVATTNGAGMYKLVALLIGNYELHAVKSGFAQSIRTGIALVVGQDATADLALRVGRISEQVKVSADVDVLNTST